MPQEIYWLALTALFTSLMWVPYIVQMIAEIGLKTALLGGGNGTVTPEKPWAARLKKAHRNTVENLVVFAPLVLAVVVTGVSSPLTVTLAMTFFFARVAFSIIFALGIPLIRTLVFAVGLACQIGLALVLLGVL